MKEWINLANLLVLLSFTVYITSYINGIDKKIDVFIASEIEHRENCALVRAQMREDIDENDERSRKNEEALRRMEQALKRIEDLLP